MNDSKYVQFLCAHVCWLSNNGGIEWRLHCTFEVDSDLLFAFEDEVHIVGEAAFDDNTDDNHARHPPLSLLVYPSMECFGWSG